MTTKGLTTLAVVTILLAVGAAFTLKDDASGSTHDESSGELFPDLFDQINDVSRVTIQAGDENFSVTRTDETWGLEATGGYPVKFETVKQALVGLANLEILQPTTKLPERWARLGLDPDEEDATTKHVILEDATGATLASILLGDTKWSGSDQTVYVRRAGEDQTFSCGGRITVPATPLEWIDRKVLQLDRTRLQATVLEAPDGETLSLSRATAEETNYTLSEVPPTRELSSPSAGSPLATWLTYLSLEDVRPTDQVDFTEAGPAIETRTFDGLVVRATTATFDGQTWATFAASYEAPPGDPEGETDTQEVGPELPAQPEVDDGPNEAMVLAEVDDLNARLAGWAFALPAHKTDQLTKTLEDFLAPLPEPEPEEESPEEDLGAE